MYEPDHFSTSTIQLEQKQVSETLPLSAFDAAKIADLAAQFKKHGDGALALTVLYDPAQGQKGVLLARNAVARLTSALRGQGVAHIQSGVLPVRDTGVEMRVMISYLSYAALPPADCQTMAGFDSRTVESEESYKLGCTLDTVFARQIAHPKDLAGQEPDTGGHDGRRASNIVEVYRTGEPNKALEAETASGDN